MTANLENSAVATGLQKFSFHFNLKEGNAKKCSNCHTIALISRVSKVMLKVLQARLRQYVNHELTDAQAGFRKVRGTRIKLPTFVGSLRKHEKNIYFCFIDYSKAFDCVNHNKLWEILKENARPSEKSVCRSRNNS